mmetsp:Transcript_7146/g.21561  ORF Transcript_7146/g.21561 Transcript_7146/m.21561 type:complete len:519 (-) Transcript_7146:168-1724(-)
MESRAGFSSTTASEPMLSTVMLSCVSARFSITRSSPSTPNSASPKSALGMASFSRTWQSPAMPSTDTPGNVTDSGPICGLRSTLSGPPTLLTPVREAPCAMLRLTLMFTPPPEVPTPRRSSENCSFDMTSTAPPKLAPPCTPTTPAPSCRSLQPQSSPLSTTDAEPPTESSCAMDSAWSFLLSDTSSEPPTLTTPMSIVARPLLLVTLHAPDTWRPGPPVSEPAWLFLLTMKAPPHDEKLGKAIAPKLLPVMLTAPLADCSEPTFRLPALPLPCNVRAPLPTVARLGRATALSPVDVIATPPPVDCRALTSMVDSADMLAMVRPPLTLCRLLRSTLPIAPLLLCHRREVVAVSGTEPPSIISVMHGVLVWLRQRLSAWRDRIVSAPARDRLRRRPQRRQREALQRRVALDGYRAPDVAELRHSQRLERRVLRDAELAAHGGEDREGHLLQRIGRPACHSQLPADAFQRRKRNRSPRVVRLHEHGALHGAEVNAQHVFSEPADRQRPGHNIALLLERLL